MSQSSKEPAEKKRLDQILVERGFAKSRAAAQRAILAGEVIVDGQIKDKTAASVPISAKIELKSKPKYASQGGLKLEKALTQFAIGVNGKTCIDIGSSTGGFTDCLLQNGAKKIYAVDVGKGQFDWSLRIDPRVVVMEEVNARYLTAAMIGEEADLIVIDVSFISLRLILPVIKKLIKATGEIVALVKPQFEAGRENVQTGGVVRDPKVHLEVLQSLSNAITNKMGFSICGATHSPFKGPAGNIEFLIHLKPNLIAITAIDWKQVVEQAHSELN